MQRTWLTVASLAPSHAGRFWLQADCRPRRRGEQQLCSLLAAIVVEESGIPGRVFRGSQELDQNPFFQQAPGARGKKQKFDPCLPHGIGPSHAPRGFDPDPRISQIEAQKNLLVYVKRSHGLNGQTGVTQIADDAAVGLIQIDIGQALNLVAIVTSSAEGCEAACVCPG